ALTGLSLLCFLGAGHTQVADGPYRDTIGRALVWLLNRQDADGDLRDGETLYSHGIAAIALAEAYAMTGDPTLYGSVERAVAFITRARNRETGGWRYNPGDVGDTSVLGWQAMALASAQKAGLAVPSEAIASARAWLARVEVQPGLYTYRPGEPVSTTMTAEAMFVRQLTGTSPDDPRMEISRRYISRTLPDWDENLNTYNWYYTALALFHHGGDTWPRWNAALVEQLLDHQHPRGAPAGSWDPGGKWASVGGRVYQTALCTLMLEIYYRYLPMYARDGAEPVTVPVPADTIGTVRGRVTEAATGDPIAEATIRLALPDGSVLSAETGPDGRYTLHVPEVPDFFALTATADGFVPAAANVSARRLRHRRLIENFRLEPAGGAVLALELVPEVHHLGNDRWTGRTNSRFQRDSEGRNYTVEFTIAPGQLSAGGPIATVELLAKGVQCPHPLYINGHELDEHLDDSPDDGSFGSFTATFDPDLLVEGVNTFEIRGRRCSGDVDDFEFVNVQIKLSR
ncbi:MAG: carboxypeptidase regulatory-like domain-containing protein, partial [Planctomycetes bacterium]|nr:carboxypeptidase regulatory-like domain-containing protein [Planctomycetota bacterium]